MLRALTLGVVLSVEIAACALTEPPPPADTIRVEVQVRNERWQGVEFSVLRGLSRRPITGAVQPPWVPARSTANLTLYIPIGQWWLAIDRWETIDRRDLEDLLRPGCKFTLELDADGIITSGCQGEP